jgi:hypothetical protein
MVEPRTGMRKRYGVGLFVTVAVVGPASENAHDRQRHDREHKAWASPERELRDKGYVA